MTSVVAALDESASNMIRGENNRVQYAWSTDIKPSIVQLHFQLVRNNNVSNKKNISSTWFISQANIFENIYKNVYLQDGIPFTQVKDNEYKERKEMLVVLHKLVAFTRDIISGKGEYALAFAMVNKISKYNESFAVDLIGLFVNEITWCNESHPLGSWKDIKYMWHLFDWSKNMEYFFIALINQQLWLDHINVMKNNPISLVSKWIPREKSKFKDLFYKLAESYYPYTSYAKNSGTLILAKKKSYTKYRQLISFLNKKLDTTQIKQCSGRYSKIDFKNVSGITHLKQKSAFLNIKKSADGSGTMETRTTKEDRILCRENYKEYINNLSKNNKTVKGKRVGIVDLVKAVLINNHFTSNSDETIITDSQANDIINNLGYLDNFIAMVDTSGSMRGDPLHAAIGLGICISEKSKLGKRILSFDREPSWINLENVEGFSNKVNTVASCSWGMNTNFTNALLMILTKCVEKKLTEEQVSNLVLVVLSDMQIDSQGNENLNESMWNHIKTLYATHGYRFVPHILFWNLRFTSGFPVSCEQEGATMFSGFSPSLLNAFTDKGIHAIKNSDPWNNLKELLDNDRYSSIENIEI
jgi:hypothetical protein